MHPLATLDSANIIIAIVVGCVTVMGAIGALVYRAGGERAEIRSDIKELRRDMSRSQKLLDELCRAYWVRAKIEARQHGLIDESDDEDGGENH